MKFRSYMAVCALALIPVLALAGQASAQSAAQPMFVNVNGQAVPVKAETHMIQTAAGPMKVSSWSWHSPHGGASFEVQTSTGGMPPAFALQQMRAMQYQMRAAQVQMMAMQQQMMALQHAAFAGTFAVPAQQAVVFSAPMWAMPEPVVVVVPARRVAPPAAVVPAKPAGIKA
ncbi:hypothetical protein [Trinickia dinghuensis]|uniref:Uncharacterized protein n=1 Tax=Trinickia dinghuensis TaxID=2291023 RepID=A0A3D8JY53_9BURK|nr:hypothetical protein [Trinickia dinghuensis]RDU97742.1 hypothetical protein DWV00_17920 [Trinickia dinghuensis]